VAITFVGAGTVAGQYGPGTTPIAVDVPSSIAAGDLLLMISGRNTTSGAGAYSTPAGWINIPEWTMSTGTNSRHSFGAYRIATSEPASYDLTTADLDDQSWGAVMVAYRGVDASTQLDATPVGDITQNGTASPNPGSITTVTNDAWVVCFAWSRDGDVSSWTPPTGYTERVEDTALFYVSVADKAVAVAGAENPGAFGTGGGGTDHHTVGTLALRPVVAGGAGTAPAIFMGVNLGKNLINGGGLIKC